jgi:hypothetical protein
MLYTHALGSDGCDIPILNTEAFFDVVRQR